MLDDCINRGLFSVNDGYHQGRSAGGDAEGAKENCSNSERSNLPEKGKDQEEIKHIIDTLEMTEEFKQTPQTTRLGKSNDRTKNRPIKIECETTDQKYMMLKRSKALARQESTRDVYIGPDLTRKERLANKDLRDELKHRPATYGPQAGSGP